MKVLIISAAYPPMQAGEATNTYHLSHQLAARGVEVHVLTSVRNTGTDEGRVHVHPIVEKWDWPNLFRIRAFIKGCAPDAVFLMYIGLMYNFHPMVTFLPTLCKRLFPQMPFITRYESAFVGADPSKTGVVSRAIRRLMVEWVGSHDVAYSSGTLLRDSDAVIALCERHRDMLVHEWGPVSGKVKLIPPPPNLRIVSNALGTARARGRELLGLKPDDFVVTFFGYLYPIKGIDTLLRAFAKVSSQRSNAKLLFIGGKVDLAVEGGASYFDEMQDLAKQLHIDGRTIWTGSFNSEEEEASLYLHASDVCVLPFLEGVQLNNSSFASMVAHGLPILVTSGPMTDKAFVHGKNVLTFAPKDSDALTTLLLEIMDHADLRERLRSGALKLADEWFSWDSAMERTLAALRPQLSGKSV